MHQGGGPGAAPTERKAMKMKRLLALALVVVAAVAAVSVATAAPQKLKLDPTAGNFPPPDFAKVTGNSTYSQAQWTNKQAHTGKFSVLLQKSTNSADCSVNCCAAYAAVVLKGGEGDNANGHTVGYWFKGDCSGGSPRINLFYDTDRDRQHDGYKF